VSERLDRRRFLAGAGALGALSTLARRGGAQEGSTEPDTGRVCDLALKGATIVDGTGAPAFVGDIGILRDRIVAVGEVSKARETVDCTGLVICPGFVDMTTHLDMRCFSALRAYPLPPHDGSLPMHCAPMLLEQGITTALAGNAGWSAPDIEAHLSDLETRGVPVNYATLVGHAALLQARGADADVSAGLQAALEAGAFGMSLDLESDLSATTPPERLAGLARVVGAADGALLSVRRRSSGAQAPEATAESLTLGRIGGGRLHLSRLRPSFDAGWAHSAEVLDMVEAARQSGLDVSADTYAHSGCGLSVAEAYLPADLRPPVYREALRDKLRSEELLAYISEQLGIVDPSAFYPRTLAWEGVYDLTIAELARVRRALNLLDFVAELALEDTAVVTGTDIPAMGLYMAEVLLPELHDTLSREFMVVGSDASALANPADTRYLFPWSYGNTARALTTFAKPEARPIEEPPPVEEEPEDVGRDDDDRPRGGGGSHVRVDRAPLPQPPEGRVREEATDAGEGEEESEADREPEGPAATLEFETMVHRLSGLPASRLGLPDRGVIKVGAYADLVVLDRKRLRDRSGPTFPTMRPAGIVRVLVNGRTVVLDGEYNGELAGAVLRR